jgi:hypothetical protein
MFSEEQLICIAVLLDEGERKSRKGKSVHVSLLQRKEEEEYFTLYKELVEDSASILECRNLSIRICYH